MYLNAFKKICNCVALFIGGVGICFIPFLDMFVKEKPAFSESLWSLYIIVLATSVASHGLSYKNIIILAKQDRYIRTIIQYTSLFVCHGLQILVLIVFQNIYLYLLVNLFSVVMAEIVSGFVGKKKYGYNSKSDLQLPKNEKKEILKDVGSLSIYKLCRTIDASVDTFLISKFVAVTTTAIYGSLNMLLSALHELLGTFNDGMIASIGDLYASEKHNKRLQDVFFQSFHLVFLLYGISTAVLVPFISGFVEWWVGYTLSNECIYIMLINYYMYGLGMNIATFRNSMGIFQKGWKRPAVTAFLNLLFSILLVVKIGLVGTLLGTLIARTCTLVWYDPYIVFKYGIKSTSKKYYIRYIYYLVSTICTASFLYYISKYLPLMTNFYNIIIDGIIYLATATLLILCFGLFIPEQKSVINRFIGLIYKPIKKNN